MSKEEVKPEAKTEAPAPDAQPPAPDYYDQLLRLKAEFENFRRRADKEKPQLVQYGKAEVLGKLLPLFDAVTSAAAEAAKHSDNPLAKGLSLISKEFEKLFAAEGLKAMDAVGKPYHHDQHDVLGTVERADMAEDTVVEVLQPGFLLHEKVLRHAKVRIAKKPAKSGDTDDAAAPAGPAA